MEINAETYDDNDVLAEREAGDILGDNNFFDICKIQDILGVKHYGRVEEIPFNKWEIEFARKNNMYLIYRPRQVWRDNKLTYLSIKNMIDIAKGTLLRNESIEAYHDHLFFNQEKPRVGWSLVSKKFNMTSLDQDFFTQMLVMAKILEERTDGFQISFQYLKRGINDFLGKYPDIYNTYIQQTLKPSWEFLDLQICRFLMRSASEIVYDFLITGDFPGMTENYLLSHTAKMNMAKTAPLIEEDIHCWTNTKMDDDDTFVLIERRKDITKNQFVLRIDHSYLDFYDNDIGLIPVINY